MIHRYERIVVLTGAGMSVPSGYPDYRSTNGLYRQSGTLSPETILSRPFFSKQPDNFYRYVLEQLYVPEATPNRGHHLLAEWERAGHVQAVITQNIDGLHERAGSTTIPFHGTADYVTCYVCDEHVSIATLAARQHDEQFHRCPTCGGVYDTNVVLYGDAGYYLSGDGFSEVASLIQSADLLLILGTSLKVTPFALLPTLATCPIVIVNHERLNVSFPVTAQFNEDIITVLERWAVER